MSTLRSTSSLSAGNILSMEKPSSMELSDGTRGARGRLGGLPMDDPPGLGFSESPVLNGDINLELLQPSCRWGEFLFYPVNC